MPNMRTACLVLILLGLRPSAASAQLTLDLQDYAAFPITGLMETTLGNESLLARINGLREEPGGASRFFVPDINGPLYILDKQTRRITTYLDFNGNPGRPGIFPKLSNTNGLGNGLNALYFDPDYARNGKFYTVHIEDPTLPGSNQPTNQGFPGLNLTGYATTAAHAVPGPLQNESILVEWTDSNTSNGTFEGTARELLRVQLNTRSHPMGDMIFNPTARPGDADWRVLYLECGDGASGESRNMAMRLNPQRLDNLTGKILRIIPDLNEHVATSTVSANGRYRIPNDNPFVSTPGARKEIWAYGFRNPHRLSWAVDPGNPANNRLLVTDVGLRTWESVDIVRKGENYGYPLREGTEVLRQDNTIGPLPAVDRIPKQITDEATDDAVVPTYPVIQYAHDPQGGDAIGSGFVYYGKLVPALRGKYLFSDITTGRVWYADYAEMLAADDGKPGTLARIHEVKLRWNNQVHDTMSPITEAGYRARGGKDPDSLPGTGRVTGKGRSDARLTVDASGELYFYTKSDGVIRAVTGGTLK